MEEPQCINYEGCDICGEVHTTENCPELQGDISVSPVSRAKLTLPHNVELVESDGSYTVVAREKIDNRTRLGPFESPRHLQDNADTDGLFVLKVFSGKMPASSAATLDTSDEWRCNWLCFIQTARSSEEQNLMAVQIADDIYYIATQSIAIGTELRVWYAPHYARKLGKSADPDETIITSLVRRNVVNSSPLPKEEHASPLSPLPDAGSLPSEFKEEPIKTVAYHPDEPSRAHIRSESGFPSPHRSTTRAIHEMSNPRQLRITQPTQGTGPRLCRRCGYTATSTQELALHVRKHLKKSISLKMTEGSHSQKPPRKRIRVSDTAGTNDFNRRPQDINATRKELGNTEKEDHYLKVSTAGTPQRKSARIRSGRVKITSAAHLLRAAPESDEDEKSVLKASQARQEPPTSEIQEPISASPEATSPGRNGYRSRNPITLTTNAPPLHVITPSPTKINFQTTPVKRKKSSKAETISEDTQLEKRTRKDCEEMCLEEEVGNGDVQKNSKHIENEGVENNDKITKINEIASHSESQVSDQQDNVMQSFTDLSETADSATMQVVQFDDQNVDLSAMFGNNSEVILLSANSGELTMEEIQELIEKSGAIDVKVQSEEGQRSNVIILNNSIDVDADVKVDSGEGQRSNVIILNNSIDSDAAIHDIDQKTSSPIPNVKEDSVDKFGCSENDSAKNVQSSHFQRESCDNDEETFENPQLEESGLDSKDIVWENTSEIQTEKVLQTIHVQIENNTKPDEVQYKSIETVADFDDAELEKIFTVEDFSAAESDDDKSNFDAQIKIQRFMDSNLEEVRESSSMFVCPACHRRFSTKWLLATHLVNHPDTACQRCEKCYKSEKSFTAHTCLAGINVTSYMSLLRHGIEHCVKVNEATQIFQCQACDRQFNSLTSLLRHVVIHDGVFVCQECGRCVTSRSAFNKHILYCTATDNENKKKLACDLCSRLFATLKHLRRHREAHQAVYSCERCGKKFMHNSNFKAHACSNKQKESKDEETEESLHHCEFCGQSFKTEKALALHLTMHTDEFDCAKCSLHYTSRAVWLKHMAICDPQALTDRGIQFFPCDQCDKVFTKEVWLINHERLHLKAFQCDTCGKSFSTQHTLIRHVCMGPKPERWECKECGRTFKKRAFLERHLPYHTGEFTCVICDKVFERKELLIKHMLHCTASVQVSTNGSIPCTVCKETFTDPRKFQEHYTKHTHPFGCDNCKQRFMRRINLDKHTCKDFKGQTFPCTECGKVFKKPQFLERHMPIHSGQVWHCERCGRDFRRPDQWRIHMCRDGDGKLVKIHHKKAGSVVREEHVSTICTICGREFHNTSNLDKHMARHFPKTMQCTQCDKKFHDKAGLKAHLENVHGTGEKKYKCEVCGKAMKCRNSLYAHRKAFHAETEVVYQCNECGKQLKSKAYLLKHIEQVHTSKLHQFSCHVCKRYFRCQEHLERHLAWHEHGQQYMCDFCDATFSMQSDVMRHMRRQHAGHVFVCEWCNMNFRQPFTLKAHLLKYHADDWEAIGEKKAYLRKQIIRIKEYAERENEWNRTYDNIELGSDATSAKQESDNSRKSNVIVKHVRTSETEEETEETRTLAHNERISQQVLEALKHISGSGTDSSSVNRSSIITIEGKNGQQIPVALPGGLSDGQGYVILPASNNDDVGEQGAVESHDQNDGQANQEYMGDNGEITVSNHGDVNISHVQMSDNGELNDISPASAPMVFDKSTFILSENGEERVLTIEELEHLSDTGVVRLVTENQ